jgi:hypothetical protein
MKMKEITVAFLALICAACASTADRTAESPEDKVYRTGSNLPVRDRNAISDVKTVDPASIQSLRDRASGAPSAVKAGN